MTTLFFAAALVAAPGDEANTPYDIDPLPHAVVAFTMFGVLGVYNAYVQQEFPGGLTCEQQPGTSHCDPKRLNALDRRVVGNRSDAWLLTSDISGAVVALGVVVGTAMDAATAGDFVTDATVILEATAIAVFATTLMKQAFRRPRPTQYSDAFTKNSNEHQLSFPSGHTSYTAALASAFATTFALRHPDSPWRFVVMGGAAGIVGVTGYGRVAGGFHFYTDVIAGAILGAGTGFVVPYFLRKRDDVMLTPVVTEGGGGASLLVRF